MGQSSSGITVSPFTKIMFVLLLVTIPTTVIGGEIVDIQDNPEIRYSAEPSLQSCEPLSGNTTSTQSTSRLAEARNYTELSPEAQKIFHRALQADRAYTTRTDPEDLGIQTDTPEPNHILYESRCYALTGQSTRNPNAAFDAFLLRSFGGALTVIFAVTCVGSFCWTVVRQRGNGE